MSAEATYLLDLLGWNRLKSWLGLGEPQNPSTPSPPSYEDSQRTYFSGGSAEFWFLDDITTPEYMQRLSSGGYVLREPVSRVVPWHAELHIRARDISILMDQGLFWSEDNIVTNGDLPELDGSLQFISSVAEALGYQYCELYELSGADASSISAWRGTLYIYAHDIETVLNFQPSQLSLANIRFAYAWDADHRLVHSFDSAGSEDFSTTSGDTPLSGWLPWPRNGGFPTSQ
ncbi:hypothetical protein NLG97_g1946 [Lecanicillium saksenae]|uniref:Uncharacterized protein n=1 Tax=Lecanicillium saksenae TaxID=468837 RepID=A0ACC1R475_9HYPO|nr:hypothetical protein NLG97_g1946 [Lecanicillium saksenae]